MKRNMIVSGLVITLAATWMVAVSVAEDKDKPKYTTKEVMKLHKEKLHEKFLEGKASKEDKDKLIEAYQALAKNKAPKGDEKEWIAKSDALVKAVKDDDKEAFKKAVNCGACHGAHKK
jgi:cytochrome c553